MNLLWLLAVVFVLAPLAGAVAHRIEQGDLFGPRLPGGSSEGERIRELVARVEGLTDRVERLAEEVDRLSEEQRFLERVLEERPGRRLEGGGEPEGPTHPERTSAS